MSYKNDEGIIINDLRISKIGNGLQITDLQNNLKPLRIGIPENIQDANIKKQTYFDSCIFSGDKALRFTNITFETITPTILNCSKIPNFITLYLYVYAYLRNSGTGTIRIVNVSNNPPIELAAITINSIIPQWFSAIIQNIPTSGIITIELQVKKDTARVYFQKAHILGWT